MNELEKDTSVTTSPETQGAETLTEAENYWLRWSSLFLCHRHGSPSESFSEEEKAELKELEKWEKEVIGPLRVKRDAFEEGLWHDSRLK